VSTNGAPLLRCTGVDVAYGPVQVLFGVDFEVAEGELVAMLGTNGAGKSTLLKAVAGLVTPQRGKVALGGQDVSELGPEKTAQAGVGLMPGGKGVFPGLTVEENLRLGGWLLRGDPARLRAARDEALDLFPVLADRLTQPAGNLSGGEQQMLALAQAFLTRPRLLLIDELSLGLSPVVVGQLFEVVRSIHEAGTTVVVVEQSVNLALTLADRAVFMEKGEIRFTGPTGELLDRPDLLRSVFISKAVTGGQPLGVSRSIDDDAPAVLECSGVVKSFGGLRAVDGVDLALRQGEILGLIGPNGAGKTTLFDCISGFLPADSGRVVLRGRDVTEWAPHDRARGGLGRSFQEARLYPSLTTWETIAVALERHLASREMVAAAPPAGVVPVRGRGGRTGGVTHRAHGPVRLPGQAGERALQRQPAHRRAGLHPGPGPGRRPPRRTLGGRGPAGDRGARSSAAPGPGPHRVLHAAHRARHPAGVGGGRRDGGPGAGPGHRPGHARRGPRRSQGGRVLSGQRSGRRTAFGGRPGWFQPERPPTR
jgi:ABC-type branched-subunit amino acid transport system ATPase component